jgi:hypothetical protein
MSRSKSEIIRRLRLGDLRSLLRARCGHTLPDDDAGREYLWELLLCVSLGAEPDLKMANAIEIWAKWMKADTARQLIDQINRTPIDLRKRTARSIGETLRVSNRERERLRLWTITPFDMTTKQLDEQRREKKRARMQRLRRKSGAKSRAVYLANSLTQIKPWQTLGISCRTWFRRRGKGNGTGPCQIKLTNYRAQTSATEKSDRPKEASQKGAGKEGR